MALPRKESRPMLISHSKKFVFLHVPKTAGTSIRAALEPHADHKFWHHAFDRFDNRIVDMAHLQSDAAHRVLTTYLDPNVTYRKFAFFRDTEERFVSGAAEVFYRNPHMFLDPEETKSPRLLSSVLQVMLKMSLTDASFVHLAPQSSFILSGTELYAVEDAPRVLSEILGSEVVLNNDRTTESNPDKIRYASAVRALLSNKGDPDTDFLRATISAFYRRDTSWIHLEPPLKALKPFEHPPLSSSIDYLVLCRQGRLQLIHDPVFRVNSMEEYERVLDGFKANGATEGEIRAFTQTTGTVLAAHGRVLPNLYKRRDYTKDQ